MADVFHGNQLLPRKVYLEHLQLVPLVPAGPVAREFEQCDPLPPLHAPLLMRAEVLKAAVVAHHQQAAVVVIGRDKVGDHVVRENITVPDHTAGLVLNHGYQPSICAHAASQQIGTKRTLAVVHH